MQRSAAPRSIVSTFRSVLLVAFLGFIGSFIVVSAFPAGAALGATIAASSSRLSPITPNKMADFPGATARSDDLAVSGVGDTDGYHIRIAEESAGFIWTDIAVIKPANLDESDWYGYQCLSDDGKYVAVAILPGDSENVDAQRVAGAYAYSVNVTSHVVTPLATGEGSFYFSPSCSTDDTATFTASLGADQQVTELTRFNLATGATVSDDFAQGQVTSAVGQGRTLFGALGNSLVTLSPGGSAASPLAPTAVIRKLDGAAYSLEAVGGGGLNFLTHSTNNSSASLWYFAHGAPMQLASGDVSRLQLSNGRAGRNLATGYDKLLNSDHIHAVKLTQIVGAPGAISLGGDAAFGPSKNETKATKAGQGVGLAPATTSSDVAVVEATQSHKLFPAKFNVGSATSENSEGKALAGPSSVPGNVSTVSPTDKKSKTTTFTTTGPVTATAATTFSLASDDQTSAVASTLGSLTLASAATSTSTPSPTGAQTPRPAVALAFQNALAPSKTQAIKPQLSPGATTPTCAVPRLTPTLQAMQPGNAQVSWAIEMAEQGYLTGSAYTRPANFDNMGLVAYAPSSDFPPVALSHPSGSTTTHVPRSVMEAIVSQESNYNQASWHALPGIAGDPLIADYYGSGGGITTINYPNADCGYGLAQVTTGMHVGDTTLSAHGQMKVAVDYEENVAAGLQILENTWNQLYAAGVTANGGDPKYLENWYFAVWAYNTGIQPTAAYGNTTGCTPGPSCTGADGTWGLGWSNNPANPSYSPSRLPYLQTSYGDAAHPSSWPYEERIMGWMGSPIVRYGFTAYAPATFNGSSTWLQVAPYTEFCTAAGNNCNPSTYSCGYSDSECWWHAPVTWVSSCSTSCSTSAYTTTSTSPDPGYTPPASRGATASCSVSTSVLPAGTLITDDLNASPYSPVDNLQCGAPSWTNSGTFTLTPGQNSSGDPIGDIDIHQLGAGFGGHIYFTHTEPASSPSLINTGVWAPSLPSTQNYKVMVHIPATGAVAMDTSYLVNPGGGGQQTSVRLNQDFGQEIWVSLGTFGLNAGATVTLTNTSAMTPGKYDVAFDAIAFIPKGGTPNIPIGGPTQLVDAPAGSNPSWVNCLCGSLSAGDPVDTGTGYFGQSAVDLSTGGRGIPLSVSRTYSSALADPSGPSGTNSVSGAFGPGWTYSYGMSATTDPSTGNVTILQEDGSRVTFTVSGSTYTPVSPRFDATLTKAGSVYTFSRRGTFVATFDTTTGHLTAEYDQAGYTASPKYGDTFAYDGSGKLHTATDAGGRSYTFTWIGSVITSVAGPSSQQVDYTYDVSGQLTDVYGVGTTRTGGVDGDQDHSQYAYSTANLMTSFRTPANYGKTGSPTPVTSMVYDASERVTSQTDPTGNTTTFVYGPNSGAGLVAGQTLVTDPAGHEELLTYNQGLVVSETKGYGSSAAETWTYAYDPVTLGISKETNPDGGVDTFTYDDYGDQTSSSDALGRTTSKTYDTAGHVLEETTPDLIQSTYTYNSAGAQLSTTVSQPGQSAESSNDTLPSSTLRTESVTYPSAAYPADPSVATDFDGNHTTFTFDTFGDLTSTTDAAGDVTKDGYDTSRGLLTSVVTPRGVAAGTTTSCTPPATGCTTYAHDAWGHVTVTTDPMGHMTKSTYDANGNALTTVDPDSNTITTTYDSADRPLTVAKPTGTVTTVYNGDGTVRTATDLGGHVTTYTYDGQGRVASVANPDSKVTSYGYDADGNQNGVTDANGTITSSTYDVAGQLTSVAYTGTLSAHSVAYTYAAGGQRASMTDATGTSTYSYDTFAELVSTTSGSGNSTGFGYDAQGNNTSITYPGAGNTVLRGFNSRNQLASVTDAGGRVTSFTYDADGRDTLVTYPNGTTDTIGYNDASQETSIALAKGSTALGTYVYGRDNAGNQTSLTTSNGALGASATYSYDGDNQLHTIVTGGATTTNTYDGATDPTQLGSTTQVFDAAQQLCWTTTSTVSTPSCGSPATGATTYTSNSDGERTTQTPSTGTATSYTWNGAGELAGISGPAVASYTYDGDGIRATKTVSGATTTFTWNPTGQVPLLLSDGTEDYIYGPGGAPIEQTAPGGASPLWYLNDAQNSTAALIDSTGTVTGRYSYSPSGITTSSTGTATTHLQYNGQYLDSESGLIYLRARYYDTSTALFLSVDAAVNATHAAFAYAMNDPLGMFDPLGLWSWGDTWAVVGIVGLVVAGIALTATGVGAVGDIGVVAGVAELGADIAGDVAIEAASEGAIDTVVDEGAGDAVDEIESSSRLVENAEKVKNVANWTSKGLDTAQCLGKGDIGSCVGAALDFGGDGLGDLAEEAVSGGKTGTDALLGALGVGMGIGDGKAGVEKLLCG
jgi:RHS repeat-associated protein